MDSHHPPQVPISPAVDQFIADHERVGVGFEAWQTFYNLMAFHNLIGMAGVFDAWRAAHDQERWNDVAKAVLEDFAVWYDAGHYRE